MSIRRTFHQYLRSLPPIMPRTSVTEVAKLLALKAKREMQAAGIIQQRPTPLWNWNDGFKSGTVAANTRSEARAEVKRVLGIKKGRMPIGVTLSAHQPSVAGAA